MPDFIPGQRRTFYSPYPLNRRTRFESSVLKELRALACAAWQLLLTVAMLVGIVALAMFVTSSRFIMLAACAATLIGIPAYLVVKFSKGDPELTRWRLVKLVAWCVALSLLGLTLPYACIFALLWTLSLVWGLAESAGLTQYSAHAVVVLLVVGAGVAIANELKKSAFLTEIWRRFTVYDLPVNKQGEHPSQSSPGLARRPAHGESDPETGARPGRATPSGAAPLWFDDRSRQWTLCGRPVPPGALLDLRVDGERLTCHRCCGAGTIRIHEARWICTTCAGRAYIFTAPWLAVRVEYRDPDDSGAPPIPVLWLANMPFQWLPAAPPSGATAPPGLWWPERGLCRWPGSAP